MKTMVQANAQSGAFSVVLPTLALLLFLAALIAVITGIALLFPGPAWIPMWNLNREAYDSFHRLGEIAVVVLFALSLVSATASLGLLFRKRWAWWIGLLLFATNGAGDLVSLIRTGEVLRFGSGALIATGFIVLLLLPQVRQRLR
jgi:hypothetical protein